jgi:hypothetical protein
MDPAHLELGRRTRSERVEWLDADFALASWSSRDSRSSAVCAIPCNGSHTRSVTTTRESSGSSGGPVMYWPVTTDGGSVQSARRPLALRRLQVLDSTGVAGLAAMLEAQ